MADITAKTVAESIGWLDAMGDPDLVEFYQADWSHVEETGKVFLSGTINDHDVHVVVVIAEVTFVYNPPMEDWYDEDEDNEE